MKIFSEFITEVMTISQRRKAARRMAKIARSPIVQAKKKKAKLRVRSTEKLAQVARKKVIQKFRDKFYPQYKESSVQQRVKIDQIIMAKFGPKIDKISRKMVVQLKKKELERVKTARANLNA
mgnify:FL=1